MAEPALPASTAVPAGAASGRSTSRSDRIPLVAAVVLLVAGLVAAAVSLWWPLGQNQGVFAWVGDTVLRGGYPYRDAFDTRGPVAYLPFALGQAAFGPQAWAIRAFDLIALALVAIPIRNALVRLEQRGAVPVALGLLLVWYLSLGASNTAQPDAWAALLGAAVTCLFLGRVRPPRFRTVVAAGVGVAFAMLLNPLYFSFALIPIAGVVLDERLAGRDRAGHLLTGFVTTIAVLLATGAVFWAGGALRTLLTGVIGPSLSAVLGHPYDFGGSLNAFVEHFRQGRMLLGVPAALAGFVALWPKRKLDAVILAFWLGTALIVPAALGRWEGHDMQAVHSAIAVLAGIGIVAAWTSSSGPARALLGVFVATLILVSVRNVILPVRDWARWQFGQETEADYARHFEGAGGDFSYRSSALIADYIARHSEPGDRVLAVENPLINYLSGRATPGRFVSARPDSRMALAIDETRQREFDASVVEGQPLWIVLGPPAAAADSLSDGVPISPSITPALAAEVRARYRLDAHCEDYFLFRRRTPDSGPAAAVTVAGPGVSCATLAGTS